MAKQLVNIGTAPNDKSGDPLRVAFTKINSNFDELYGLLLPDFQELIQDTVAAMIANGTLFGLSVVYDDPNNTLNLYNTSSPVDGGFASAVFSPQDLVFDGGNATTDAPTDMLINGGTA